jgi:hypothetical protein
MTLAAWLSAIFALDEVPEKWRHLTEINLGRPRLVVDREKAHRRHKEGWSSVARWGSCILTKL